MPQKVTCNELWQHFAKFDAEEIRGNEFRKLYCCDLNRLVKVFLDPRKFAKRTNNQPYPWLETNTFFESINGGGITLLNQKVLKSNKEPVVDRGRPTVSANGPATTSEKSVNAKASEKFKEICPSGEGKFSLPSWSEDNKPGNWNPVALAINFGMRLGTNLSINFFNQFHEKRNRKPEAISLP